jgi:hypothetical protein
MTHCSAVLRTARFDSIRTTAASMSVVRFIFFAQATDNAARPSESVKTTYELRSLKIDLRYFHASGADAQQSTRNHSKRKKPYSK